MFPATFPADFLATIRETIPPARAAGKSTSIKTLRISTSKVKRVLRSTGSSPPQKIYRGGAPHKSAKDIKEYVQRQNLHISIHLLFLSIRFALCFPVSWQIGTSGYNAGQEVQE